MNWMYYLVAQLAPNNEANCPVDKDSASCNINLPQVTADQATIVPILQIFFGILGLVAVIIIITAGIKFIISQGEPQKLKDARNTIIWAVLGLVIALSAEAGVYILVNII